MDHTSALEALLFWKGEPQTKTELCRMLDLTNEEFAHAVETLHTRLTGGLRLMQNGDSYMLTTSQDVADVIQALESEDESPDLSRPAQETLALIVYSGPIAKQKIDYVRGVNSVFILRNLMVRGLIEKIPDPTNKRVSLYQPTFELLSRLGVTRKEDLPSFETLAVAVETFAENKQEEQDTHHV